MTTVQEIYETIDAFAPFASQESWDNSGLLAGAGTQPAEKILTTLDISQGVIAEAAAQGVQLIVSHHPVIFSPLKRCRCSIRCTSWLPIRSQRSAYIRRWTWRRRG